MAHANALDMYQIALDFDIDVIAHGIWNWGEENAASGILIPVRGVLEKVRNNEIGFMPSLRIVAGLGEIMLSDLLETPNFKKVMPQSLQDWYAQADAQWFKEELLAAEDLPLQLFTRIYRTGIVGRGMRALNFLHSLDFPLLLGSDTPGSPSYINQPGLNTYQEMQLMAEAGIPLMNIFESATINNARQFNLDGNYGTVEVGKIANLLLLHENPLEDIEAWNTIETVVLNGTPILRESLAAEN